MLNKKAILILRISCCCLLLGRAWQHLLWDAPFRAILWDEALLKSFVEGFLGLSWHQYVTDPTSDAMIQNTIKTTGVFYLLMAVLVLFIRPTMKKLGTLTLLLASASLTILALLYYKEKFFHVGQFFEYASQFAAPLFLYLALFKKINIKYLSIGIKVAIALTFICHGLYAYGYYPRPGNYVDMTLNILPIREPAAHALLKVLGVLDFVAAVALFIPKVQVPALIYTFVWGGMTALARIVAYIDFNMFWASINQWMLEVLIRVPHAGLPLLMLIILGVKIPSFKLKKVDYSAIS